MLFVFWHPHHADTTIHRVKLKSYNLYMNSPLFDISENKAVRVPLDEHSTEIDVKAVCGRYKKKASCEWSIYDNKGKRIAHATRKLKREKQVEMFMTVTKLSTQKPKYGVLRIVPSKKQNLTYDNYNVNDEMGRRQGASLILSLSPDSQANMLASYVSDTTNTGWEVSSTKNLGNSFGPVNFYSSPDEMERDPLPAELFGSLGKTWERGEIGAMVEFTQFHQLGPYRIPLGIVIFVITFIGIISEIINRCYCTMLG